ncbi:hypothetical protein EI42_01246 [Thermosporothrix hazakensis]|jgi:hypothetical protein|uniref:DUF5348 domain-containing protein n=2 Tax=Thermosporothrix TaxID=768650 RepID=A0A326UCR5_THEHA|nr:DUF5348 domain-containing protein [Thermosporothrix hazakensis]PZW34409.1 hypothetical protein EI42_01246 [Thermosporothrix hazakensis]BBH85532.1 hypothetical protein KTC_02830 [Thermosporothrix sp. COM3]GCE46041.1 hypothetical protein KTH_09100 [Thermosporothrix hazakensis]
MVFSSTENHSGNRDSRLERLTSRQQSEQLLLQGQPLYDGMFIEIRIFGHWLPGHVALDSTGWYLLTLDNVGIRLRAGIPARFPVSRRWSNGTDKQHPPS